MIAGWIDERVGGWVDGWMDGLTKIQLQQFILMCWETNLVTKRLKAWGYKFKAQ